MREVPELAERSVVIVGLARRAGKRTKIAVRSLDETIDPVDAVCGLDGERIMRIVGMLGDVEVDVVPWDESPAILACNALAPLEVVRVIIDEERHVLEMFVPDEQIHEAPGADGLRLQLAADLTGWGIDVHRASKYRPSSDATQ